MAVQVQPPSFWCSWPMAMVHHLLKVLSAVVGHTASLDNLPLPSDKQFLQHRLKTSLAQTLIIQAAGNQMHSFTDKHQGR